MRAPKLLRSPRQAVGLALQRLGRKIWGSAYKGGEASRLFMDWIFAPLNSADQDMRSEFRALRANARDIARNNPYIKQYEALLVSNVLGPNGVVLRAQVRGPDGSLADRVNAKIEAAWSQWCQRVSVDGKMGLTRFCRLVLKTVARDGEAFVRKITLTREQARRLRNPFRIALQQIDADLLDHEYNVARGPGQNEVRLGVEVDEWGAPVGYWFWNGHPADVNPEGNRAQVFVPASEVYHIYDPERCQQTRGITWYVSVMRCLKMLHGYSEAELVAARTGAAKMGFFEWKDTADFAPPPDPKAPRTMDATPGTIAEAPPGMTFKSWDPTHPSSAFPDATKQWLREAACGLRVSYNALANDLENVNYSSIRSGLLIERDYWRTLQRWFIETFVHPLYCDWVRAALLSGSLALDGRDPAQYEEVKWRARGWRWVDPLKDIQAEILAIDAGLSSRTAALDEEGEDEYEDLIADLAWEQELAREKGVSLAGMTAARPLGRQPTPDEPPNEAEPGAVAASSGPIVYHLVKSALRERDPRRRLDLFMNAATQPEEHDA